MTIEFYRNSLTAPAGTLVTGVTPETGAAFVRTTANAAHAAPVIDSTGGRSRGNYAGNLALYSPTAATQDGESHKLTFDVVTNVGGIGVGTRCTANGGYFGYLSGGVFRIMRLKAGSYTQLTTISLAPAVGTHEIEIKATGTSTPVNLEIWYDGVSKGTFADTSADRWNVLAGVGLIHNVVDSDTTGMHASLSVGTQPDPIEGLVMSFNSPVSGYMFARTPLFTGTSGTVTAGYSYAGGTPTTIEARLVSSSGGPALPGFDWSTKVPAPSGGGGTMTFAAAPTGGPFYVQQRDSATPGTVVESNPFYIGARFPVAGQSPGLRAFTSGDSTLVPHPQLRVTSNLGTWNAANTATMNGAIAFGNAMIAALGCPVALMDYAVDGSGLVVVSNGARWVPSGSNAYVAFKAGLDAVGGLIEGMIWAQGEGDAIQTVSQTDYYNGLTTLFSTVRTDVAQPNLPIVLVTLGRRLDGTLADANSESIKSAQAQKCLDAFIARVDRMHLPVSGDNIHQLPPGFTAIYSAGAEAMKFLHGLPNSYRGPSITSVTQANATTFDVNLAHHAGNDITPVTGITGFSAIDPDAGNALIAVSSAARQSASTIRLVLASAPAAGKPLIRYLYGTNPAVTGAAKDNSALALPLEYNSGVVAQELNLASIGWTEGSETVAITGSTAVPGINATAEWTEGSETVAISATSTVSGVTAAAAWTEGGEVVHAALTSSAAPVAAVSAWVEGSEFISITAAATTSITAVAGWIESPESVVISIAGDRTYARAPSGDGYRPRIGARQIRPPAIQG